MPRFEALNAQVLGISVDSRHTQLAWANELGVTYPLLADNCPPAAVIKRYGIYNAEACNSERTIIIVDKQGIVRYIDVHAPREVPDEEQILEALQAL